VGVHLAVDRLSALTMVDSEAFAESTDKLGGTALVPPMVFERIGADFVSSRSSARTRGKKRRDWSTKDSRNCYNDILAYIVGNHVVARSEDRTAETGEPELSVRR
ncbi:MAG: hypothetical protein ACKPKO_60205, partial [Candidatus Fonsibacter sp.]